MTNRNLIMPDLGLDPNTPIRLSLWLARPGDSVETEQSLVEIVSGPLVVDLPSPADGTLIERRIGEDQSVRPGDVLGVIRLD